MPKTFSLYLLAGCMVFLVTIAAAQEKKQAESPAPAQSLSRELLWGWNSVGNKLIAMAEDFPEDKYGFKAQKDERTFGENLLHVAAVDYYIINAISGRATGFTGSMDSLRKKYSTKAEIIGYLKQAIADGAKLIEEHGDSAFTREFKSWGNRMVHVSSGLTGAIEHAGEHYGQLVVYYRINGLVPPASRPRK
jgi:uncharacterized damage-inducible protein DinB